MSVCPGLAVALLACFTNVRLGRPSTTRLAVLEGEPIGAWLLDTPEDWLVWVPVLLLVTTIETVQLLFRGIVRPLKVSAVWPLAKLLPPTPAQVPPAVCAPETAKFVNVSLKPAEVRFMPLLLASVKVIVVFAP